MVNTVNDSHQDYSGNVVKLTKADELLGYVTKSLVCGTAGTVNFTDESGNVCEDYPLQQGYNPIRIKQLSTGGTADDIWALR